MNAERIQEALQPVQVSPELAKAYLNKVYLWMATTLVTAAAVAVATAHSVDTLTWVLQHQLMLCLFYIGTVVVMCFGARALPSGAMALLLLVFAGLSGLSFGPLLTLYTQQSLGLTFGVTAGMFGAMSLYGACTKRDLSAWGRTLMMLLFGLVLALVVNIFWGNGLMDLVCSAVGVVLFALLTAYDTQKLLQEGLCEDEELRRKGAILGALTLYLDFINMFLFLLRFLGQQRD
ncbi:MAG: Bax inhibitor-1/YccA family protein [Akkermansia sp.]